MPQTYKNAQAITLAGTTSLGTAVTLYTTPAAPGVAIVRSIRVKSGGSTAVVHVAVRDSSAAVDREIVTRQAPTAAVGAETSMELLSQPLVLEGGDILKVWQDDSTVREFVASLLEIT
jgi:hypothetical protein